VAPLNLLDPTRLSVRDLCKQSLRECGRVGVGQTPLADDITETQFRLQTMLQQWERKRWLVYHLKTYGLISTGAQSYTVGPGGQFNTSQVNGYAPQSYQLLTGGVNYAPNDTITLAVGANDGVPAANAVLKVLTVGAGGAVATFGITTLGAYVCPLPITFTQGSTSGVGTGVSFSQPIWQLLANPVYTTGITAAPRKLESAFLRQIQNSQPNQVDYPLRILQSKEDYSRIALKSLVSFPGAIFLDSDWQLAQVFPYPVPQAGIYSINITVREQLPAAFTNLDTVVCLPYDYFNCVLFNLALRNRPRYGIPSFPGDELPALAKDALNCLRGPNTQIAALTLPDEITRPGIYNIFSDTNY